MEQPIPLSMRFTDLPLHLQTGVLVRACAKMAIDALTDKVWTGCSCRDCLIGRMRDRLLSCSATLEPALSEDQRFVARALKLAVAVCPAFGYSRVANVSVFGGQFWKKSCPTLRSDNWNVRMAMTIVNGYLYVFQSSGQIGLKRKRLTYDNADCSDYCTITHHKEERMAFPGVLQTVRARPERPQPAAASSSSSSSADNNWNRDMVGCEINNALYFVRLHRGSNAPGQAHPFGQRMQEERNGDRYKIFKYDIAAQRGCPIFNDGGGGLLPEDANPKDIYYSAHAGFATQYNHSMSVAGNGKFLLCCYVTNSRHTSMAVVNARDGTLIFCRDNILGSFMGTQLVCGYDNLLAFCDETTEFLGNDDHDRDEESSSFTLTERTYCAQLLLAISLTEAQFMTDKEFRQKLDGYTDVCNTSRNGMAILKKRFIARQKMLSNKAPPVNNLWLLNSARTKWKSITVVRATTANLVCYDETEMMPPVKIVTLITPFKVVSRAVDTFVLRPKLYKMKADKFFFCVDRQNGVLVCVSQSITDDVNKGEWVTIKLINRPLP